MFKHSPSGKGTVYVINGKQIMALTSLEKGWFYERLIFKVVIVMVKDKRYSIKYKMLVKIILKRHMKWARVMLPVVFEEFETFVIIITITIIIIIIIIIILLLFTFHYHCKLVKDHLFLWA